MLQYSYKLKFIKWSDQVKMKESIWFFIVAAISCVFYLITKALQRKLKKNTINKNITLQLIKNFFLILTFSGFAVGIVAPSSIKSNIHLIYRLNNDKVLFEINSDLIVLFGIVFAVAAGGAIALNRNYIQKALAESKEANFIAYEVTPEKAIGRYSITSTLISLIGCVGVFAIGYYKIASFLGVVILLFVLFLLTTLVTSEGVYVINEVYNYNQYYTNELNAYLADDSIEYEGDIRDKLVEDRLNKYAENEDTEDENGLPSADDIANEYVIYEDADE